MSTIVHQLYRSGSLDEGVGTRLWAVPNTTLHWRVRTSSATAIRSKNTSRATLGRGRQQKIDIMPRYVARSGGMTASDSLRGFVSARQL
jgi:hypothetical protein